MKDPFKKSRFSRIYFKINREKLMARVAIPDIRGLKVYNIFNGTTVVIID